ncbi:magnesium citrate secondary transporter [Algoriphagus sp.]|uniref:magnesium citrate secondary transporter n=1 Tax=Algoriphagus sp. TaxID=1872435 RepID=UPI002625B8CE|nr:magnesium citrate secondary transporter [Algoriphagus sp.]
MTVLKNPFFFFPVLLFGLNQLLEKAFQIFIPIIHAYLDDLLAMPVILGITLQLFRWMHPAKNSYIFAKTPIIISWVYVSLVFEWFLPRQSPQYISDPWDILCYGMGTIYFYRWMNKPKAQ